MQKVYAPLTSFTRILYSRNYNELSRNNKSSAARSLEKRYVQYWLVASLVLQKKFPYLSMQKILGCSTSFFTVLSVVLISAFVPSGSSLEQLFSSTVTDSLYPPPTPTPSTSSVLDGLAQTVVRESCNVVDLWIKNPIIGSEILGSKRHQCYRNSHYQKSNTSEPNADLNSLF